MRPNPMFLSRLNEMRGGRVNTCFVSGSLRRTLKFLTMTFLGMNFKLLKTDSNDYIRNVLYKKRLEKDT